MSAPNTGPEAPSANEEDLSAVVAPEGEPEAAESDTEPETYPAEVVRKLRDENAKARTRAKDAETRLDTLSRELFTLKVAALDKLADVSDLEYSTDLLDDPDALAAAVDELITQRPHYAKRHRPNGSVGQGNQGSPAPAPTFASLLHPHG